LKKKKGDLITEEKRPTETEDGQNYGTRESEKSPGIKKIKQASG